MELNEKVLYIINSICAALDPLFQKYGFTNRIRESEKSLFIEVVIYEKDAVQFRISACLHPHDYPNSLNVDLNRKIGDYWEYRPVYVFIQRGEVDFIDDDLFILPESKLENTISRLYDICEFVLANKRYLKTY